MTRAATFLALAVLSLSSCGRTVAPPPGAEELALAKASAETADRENAQLRRRIADLEAEVRRPAAEQSAPARGAAADDGRSAEMAALREEGARYKAGLDKCVAQLNDVSTQPHQTAPARDAPTAPAAQTRVY